MNDAERLLCRDLERQVHDETDHARVKFPADKSIEALPLVYGQNALMEEVGKLSRAFNKLVIAQEPNVIAQWDTEARHRIITSISLLERLYLTFRQGGRV